MNNDESAVYLLVEIDLLELWWHVLLLDNQFGAKAENVLLVLILQRPDCNNWYL